MLRAQSVQVGRVIVLGGAVLVLAASGLAAEVKLGVREDGTTLIYNERPEHRERRTAPRLVTVPDPEIERWIRLHANAAGLDVELVQAVVQVESGYNPWAVSRKGALGLMQLIPETAQLMEVDDVFDPADNIRGGTTYLRRLLDRFDGRFDLALASYNAGPETVERYRGIPPFRETQDYVRHVLLLWRGEEAAAAAGKSRPEVRVVRDERNRLVITTDPEQRR